MSVFKKYLKPKTISFTIALPVAVYESIDSVFDHSGADSRNNFLVMAVKNYVDCLNKSKQKSSIDHRV